MKRARAVKLLQNKCKYRHRKAQSVIILVLITLASYECNAYANRQLLRLRDLKMLRLQFIYSTLIRIISFCFVSFRLVKHRSCTYPSVQWRQQRKWTHTHKWWKIKRKTTKANDIVRTKKPYSSLYAMKLD